MNDTSLWINEHWEIRLHGEAENISRAENRKDVKQGGKLDLWLSFAALNWEAQSVRHPRNIFYARTCGAVSPSRGLWCSSSSRTAQEDAQTPLTPHKGQSVNSAVKSLTFCLNYSSPIFLSAVSSPLKVLALLDPPTHPFPGGAGTFCLPSDNFYSPIQKLFSQAIHPLSL